MVRKRYCAAIVAVVSAAALVLAGCSQSSQQEAS